MVSHRPHSSREIGKSRDVGVSGVPEGYFLFKKNNSVIFPPFVGCKAAQHLGSGWFRAVFGDFEHFLGLQTLIFSKSFLRLTLLFYLLRFLALKSRELFPISLFVAFSGSNTGLLKRLTLGLHNGECFCWGEFHPQG